MANMTVRIHIAIDDRSFIDLAKILYLRRTPRKGDYVEFDWCPPLKVIGTILRPCGTTDVVELSEIELPKHVSVARATEWWLKNEFRVEDYAAIDGEERCDEIRQWSRTLAAANYFSDNTDNTDNTDSI
jgi:hypothetical protein